MASRNRLKPIDPAQWSPRHARHLLNRAGFGIPEDRIVHLASLSPEAAVASLMEYRRAPDNLVPPNFLITQEEYRAQREEARTLPEDQRRKLNNQLQVRERASMLGLQAWWVERMIHTPRPLQEKMTLFWHGHFATSAQKVKASAANYHLNSLFRQHATGNFKALTTAVGQSPAMLRYLDNVQNVKAQPNENWARELMELFTMGVGHYTENDIKESARAFTGWTVDNAGQFHFAEERHDFDAKKVFGKTGNFDGWDMINLIFEQPVTAEFISRKLWTFFAYENPEPEIVKSLAEILRAQRYEIAPVLEAIFNSEAFYSDKAVGTQIKSPAQFLVQLSHHLRLQTPPYVALARASGQLGQQLFYPPNVAGWKGGREWINANTLLQRYNMSRSIVVADLVEPDEMSMLDMGAMQKNVAGAYRDKLQAALQGMPTDKRETIKLELKNAATPEERKNISENVILDSEAGHGWDLRSMFATLTYKNAGECVNALSARYLNAPLSADQQRIVLAALTPSHSPETPLSEKTLTNEQMAGALHLLFSLAEYQLC